MGTVLGSAIVSPPLCAIRAELNAKLGMAGFSCDRT
jgi:hypothetical protein